MQQVTDLSNHGKRPPRKLTGAHVPVFLSALLAVLAVAALEAENGTLKKMPPISHETGVSSSPAPRQRKESQAS